MQKYLTKRNLTTAVICLGLIYASNRVQAVKNLVGPK